MRIEDKIKNVFSKSWNVFSNNFVVLILGTILAIFLMIFVVTIPPMIFGLYILGSNVIKGKDAKVSDIFKGFDYFFRSWGLVILLVLGITLGLVFLIIPGLLLMILWQYTFSIAVIEKTGITASMKRSYNLAKENFAFSIILFIILLVISSLGSYTKIGTLLTLPFGIVATTVAVQMLSKKKSTMKKKMKK